MQRYSKIIGIGGYLPNKIVTNDDLSEIMDTSDEWIVTRTGISERRITEKKTSDLAIQSALSALSDSNIDASDIDMIIVATATPDSAFPSVANKVQNAIGAKNSFAFDINVACSGYIYALVTANNYILSNYCKTVLIIGSEKMSSLIDWNDRSTAVLFGDGAGAIILQASDEPGILKSILYADSNSQHENDLYVANNKILMNGQEVFKSAVIGMQKICNELLDAYDYSADDIRFFVPHQANIRIIDALASRMKLDQEKILKTVKYHANTSSASIPLAIYTIKNNLQRGDLLLLTAFGAGFSSGGILLKY